MKHSEPAPGVTLAQAASILSRRMRRVVTPSQVRAILVLDSQGKALAPRRKGDTRLFTAEEIAQALVVLRLRAAGVSAMVARLIVANRRDELINAWHQNLPMALGVVGMRGMLLWRGKEPEGVIAWVDLPDVWRGLVAAVDAAQTSEFRAASRVAQLEA